MLVEFDFAVTQTAYVKAAMDEIPTFRPDGLTPASVQALVDGATPVRAAYVTKKEAITGARALRHTTIDALHEGCVDFAAQGQSRFRKNPTVAARFQRLPTRDETFQKTITRGTASEALWTVLPLVGTPPAAFTVGQGTTTLALAGFTALITAARAADGAIPASDEDFQGAEADLHAKMAELEDVVTAALEQGRSQFAVGTPQREIIDAIPTATGGGGGAGAVPGAPQNPGVATGAAGSGTVNFTWSANVAEDGVLSYKVYREGAVLATVAAPAISVELDGFSPGESVTLSVSAVNAAGEGPQSEAATGTAG